MVCDFMTKNEDGREQESNSDSSNEDARDQIPVDDAAVSDLEGGLAAEIEEQEESRPLDEELKELKDRYLRLQADIENVRKRAARDRQEAYNYGHENLVKSLLATVDNLERAIQHSQAGGQAAVDIEALQEGIELVYRELIQVLERFYVTPIEALGDPFDPAVHEAMAQQESSDVEPNTVVEVFAKGYLLRDRLLRPAKVIVSKEASQQDLESAPSREEE
jgi:molecular chaperone GrpE